MIDNLYQYGSILYHYLSLLVPLLQLSFVTYSLWNLIWLLRLLYGSLFLVLLFLNNTQYLRDNIHTVNNMENVDLDNQNRLNILRHHNREEYEHILHLLHSNMVSQVDKSLLGSHLGSKDYQIN